MKLPIHILTALPAFAFAISAIAAENHETGIIDHINKAAEEIVPLHERSLLPPVDSSKFRVRTVEEIMAETPKPDFQPTPINKVFAPWVFSGYRNTPAKRDFTPQFVPDWPWLKVATDDSVFANTDAEGLALDSVAAFDSPLSFVEETDALEEDKGKSRLAEELSPGYIPGWLRNALTQYRIQEDFMYDNMVETPKSIEYAYWDLPVPPRLADDDVSFKAYIRKLDLPDVKAEKAILPGRDNTKIHWLHGFNAYSQFSQAYVSSNWYQGGNNNVSLLLGTNWNVQLNQVYHPNLLFQSNLSYKLGLNSTPQDEVHAYSISEDVLQWNLNTGVKAFKKWYYSLTAQFKTQLFRNYKNNSEERKASFLSPGDFNVGLGMSYSTKSPKVQLTASIAPLSYNLKTCITDKISHTQFNIEPNRKGHSEFGSNSEINMTWKVMWNISYKTRLFLFTDYKYFLGDWEHTLNFDVNKFLSTQIYVHMRYDHSSETNTKWKHFMLREVLSFGLSYSFSTK